MCPKYVYDPRTSREGVELGKDQSELDIGQVPFSENVPNLVLFLCK